MTPEEFAAARLDEDEQWALAASSPYPYADGKPAVPPGGVHWQWGAGENWEPVILDPAASEFVAEPGHGCALVTVETWQSGRWDMPRSYADTIVQMDTAAAGHIARHDPARVLREIGGGRRVLERHRADQYGCMYCERRTGPRPCPDLADLLSRWSDHQDYDPSWIPE